MALDEPTSTVDSSQALIGKVLEGKYRLDELVASGAMGGVYAGTHVGLGKKVAIKVLHPWLARDMRSCQRFLQEARAICSLSHRNVVAVDRCGKDGSCIYIAMEYLEGESLADRIKRNGPMHPDEAVYIVTEAAAGLAHAHAEGILHRDVKPSNIMLGTADSASVHVVDFGIAKFSQVDAEEQPQNLTSTNGTVGTPYYMSPEQIAHQDVDQRSDVYSLGCVLYEALTGNVPFRGESAFSVMLAHAQEQVPTMPKQVPMWLQTVVGKAMAKDRDQRYQTMGDFRRALLEKQEAPHMVRRRKRQRRYTGVVIAVACLVGVGAGLISFQQSKKEFDQSALPPEIRTAESEKDWSAMVSWFDAYLAKIPDGASSEPLQKSAVREVGAAAVQEWARGHHARAAELFKHMKRFRDAQPSVAAQRASWPYMGEIIADQIVLNDLKGAGEDADYFLQSTRSLDGASSVYYAHALAMKAELEWYSRNLGESKRLFEEAIRIADQTTPRRAEEKITREQVYEQTLAHYFTVDPKAAESAALKALRYNLDQSAVSPASLAQIYHSLAIIYAHEKKWQQCDEAAHKAIVLTRGFPDDDLVSTMRLLSIGNIAKDQSANDLAWKFYSEGEGRASRLTGKDQDTYLAGARVGKIFILSRLKRLEERDKLLKLYLNNAPNDTVRGLFIEVAGVMLSEGPDYERGRKALWADVEWDLNHKASDAALFDDYLRIAALELTVSNRTAFLNAVALSEKHATTDVLKARLAEAKASWGLK